MPDVAYSGSRAIAAPSGESCDAHLFAQVRTLRISQLTGFNFSTGPSISPLAPLGHSRNGAADFHPFSRVDVSAWARAASTLLEDDGDRFHEGVSDNAFIRNQPSRATACAA